MFRHSVFTLFNAQNLYTRHVLAAAFSRILTGTAGETTVTAISGEIMDETTNRIVNKCRSAAMQKIVVTNEDLAGSQVEFSFTYTDSVYKINRKFHFRRNPAEMISSVVLRIEANILKFINRKKKQENLTCYPVKILRSDTPFDINCNEVNKYSLCDIQSNITCKEALVTFGSHHFLEIGSSYFYFDVNPPAVTAVSLPDSILVDYLVYPNYLDVVFADIEDCQIIWFLSQQVFTDYGVAMGKLNTITWDHLQDGFLLRTSEDMIGKLLKVVVTPSSGDRCGEPTEALARALVKQGPGVCPYHTRHLHTTQATAHKSVRVVSYNLLADTYARTEFSAAELFPSCPAYALDGLYRKQLLLDEIIGYQGDVVCLQEVDRDLFKYDLSPVLRLRGREGIYCGKGITTVREGPALFYNTSKFRLVESSGLLLSEILGGAGGEAAMDAVQDDAAHGSGDHDATQGSGDHDATQGSGDHDAAQGSGGRDAAQGAVKDEGLEAMWARVRDNAAAEARVINRSSVLQVVVLEHLAASGSQDNVTRTGDKCGDSAGGGGRDLLVVGNTHLYFHPNADHVRLVQTIACLAALQGALRHLQDQQKKAGHGGTVRLLFCGDFNSSPDSGAFQVATSGRVDADHPSWCTLEAEAITGASFSHGLQLSSGCGTPPYTNYTEGFHGCLDYIFHQPQNMRVDKVVPLPTHEEVTAHTALPSPVIPSDHLALVADLTLL